MRARSFEVEKSVNSMTGEQRTLVNTLVEGTSQELAELAAKDPELWDICWTRATYKQRKKPIPSCRPYFDSGEVTVDQLLKIWNGWGRK